MGPGQKSKRTLCWVYAGLCIGCSAFDAKLAIVPKIPPLKLLNCGICVMTPEQLNELLQRNSSLAARNAHLSHPSDGASPYAQPEPPVQHEPVGAKEGENRHAASFRVRIKSFRVRLCDPDNLTPKYFLDACRYAGLIPDDRPQDIILEVTQEKVKSVIQERTEITVEAL